RCCQPASSPSLKSSDCPRAIDCPPKFSSTSPSKTLGAETLTNPFPVSGEKRMAPLLENPDCSMFPSASGPWIPPREKQCNTIAGFLGRKQSIQLHRYFSTTLPPLI